MLRTHRAKKLNDQAKQSHDTIRSTANAFGNLITAVPVITLYYNLTS